MKDEKPVATTVDEALHNAKDKGADFVNAEEYVEGEVPVADTPIFAEAANQEVLVEEVPVEEVPVAEEVPVDAPVEETPVFSTDYTAFDEASEFAQPEKKKGNLIPIFGMLIAFVFLLGICFFAISSKDGSIKSFLRIETPDKEESKKVEDNTPVSNEIEEPEEVVEELQVEEPVEEEKPSTSKPGKNNSGSSSSSSNSGSSSSSNNDVEDDYDFGLNVGGGDSNLTHGTVPVEEDNYVRHYAYYLFDNGYAHPKNKIQKHELAKMICLYNNLDPDSGKMANPYSDVNTSTPNYKYIITAASYGYLSPLGTSGEFKPTDNVRRDEAAAIMVNMAQKNGVTIPSYCSGNKKPVEFEDAAQSAYSDAVLKIGRMCIAVGDGDGNFSIAGEIQRGHFAYMFGRVMDRESTYSTCVAIPSNPFKDIKTSDTVYPYMIDAFITRDCER